MANPYLPWGSKDGAEKLLRGRAFRSVFSIVLAQDANQLSIPITVFYALQAERKSDESGEAFDWLANPAGGHDSRRAGEITSTWPDAERAGWAKVVSYRNERPRVIRSFLSSSPRPYGRANESTSRILGQASR